MKHKKSGKTAAVLLSIFAAALSAGCAKSPNQEFSPLTMNFLKVGKADAIILQDGREAAVIDVGEEDDGREVVDFLRNQGVVKIETLIITHFDKDHVGGADTLINELDVGTVYTPDYQGNSTEYADFISAAEKKGLTITRLTDSVQAGLGDAKLLIEPPLSYEPPVQGVENDNNFSLITTVTHGKNRMVFMGDAEKQRILEWLGTPSAVDCDFLKAPHHGVYNTALDELFTAISPEYAVICTSKKNPAEPKTLELLKQHGTDVLQTKDGNITVISDGQRLELHQKLK